LSPTFLLLEDALLHMNNIFLPQPCDCPVLSMMLMIKRFHLPFAPLNSEKLT